MDNLSTSKYNCPRCHYKTNDRYHFTKHLNRKTPCPSQYSERSQADILTSIEKAHKCPHCNKSFTLQTNLDRHEKTHACEGIQGNEEHVDDDENEEDEEDDEVINISLPSPKAVIIEDVPANTTMTLANSLVAEHGGRIIAEMRNSDGYVNATKMCQSGGKEWSNYFKSGGNKIFIDELKRSLPDGRDLYQTITTGPNLERGTWIHHKLAIHLAMWISPVFAVAVTDLVTRFLSGSGANIQAKEDRQIVKSIAFPDFQLSPMPPDAPGMYFALLKDVRNDKFSICEDIPEGKSAVGFGYSDSSIRDRIDVQNTETGGCYRMIDYVESSHAGAIEREFKQLLKYQDDIKSLSGKCAGKPGKKTEFFAANQTEYAKLFEYVTNLAMMIAKKRKDDFELQTFELEFRKIELRKVEIESASAARIAESDSAARIAESEVRKLELQLEIMKFQALHSNPQGD